MTITDVISNLKTILSFNNIKSSSVPPPLVLAAADRSGLSATKSTQNILKKKQELGLPVGTLDDGTTNLDDIMIGYIIQEIFRALQEDAKIQIAVEQFGSVTSSGVAGPGIPVTTEGVVTTIQTGGGIIS